MSRLSHGLPLAAVAAFFVAVATPLHAQATQTPVDVDALGPQVGDRVPGFSLRDQGGTLRTLDSIMGPNGAMLLFHRSADW